MYSTFKLLYIDYEEPLHQIETNVHFLHDYSNQFTKWNLNLEHTPLYTTNFCIYAQIQHSCWKWNTKSTSQILCIIWAPKRTAHVLKLITFNYRNSWLSRKLTSWNHNEITTLKKIDSFRICCVLVSLDIIWQQRSFCFILKNWQTDREDGKSVEAF